MIFGMLFLINLYQCKYYYYCIYFKTKNYINLSSV